MSDTGNFRQLVADYICYDHASKKYDRDKVLRLFARLGMSERMIVGWASGVRVPDSVYEPLIVAYIRQEMAQASVRWVKMNQWISVAFSAPCRECYFFSPNPSISVCCDKPDKHHGHIELKDDREEYYTFIRFRCYSQAGVMAVAEFNTTINRGGGEALLDLAEVKALPQELTEEEKIVISSPDEMEALAKEHVWWG